MQHGIHVWIPQQLEYLIQMVRVQLQQLTKRFGSVIAIDAVDLEVAAGEFMVLVGPSGCGKTTLLRVVAGLVEETAGIVRFDGRDVTPVPPGERDVAMIFQDYALFPHMTVARNLSFGLRLPSRSERDAHVLETARLLQIDQLLSRYPHELSGGQKQRVALGRVIIRRPAVLLFDEPLSDLDQQLRAEMRAEILHLHDGFPTTTIYVTHDQTEAMTMGQRIAVMNKGRIHQIGQPMDIYNNPVDIFTAGFIGNPAMNMLEVVVEAVDGTLHCRGEHEVALLLNADDVGWQAPWPNRLTLGVRPEHLRLCNPEEQNTIGAEIVLVEKLGRECIVHMQRGNLTLRSVVHDGTPLHQGEGVHVSPLACNILAFDTATGLRVQQ